MAASPGPPASTPPTQAAPPRPPHGPALTSPGGWRHVVTAFVQAGDGRVAVVKRSAHVGSYAGLHGAVSGFLEVGDDALPPGLPVGRALAEVAEEVGLPPARLALAACGRPLACDGGAQRRFIVHPVRFCLLGAGAPALAINWENESASWVEPAELEVELVVVAGVGFGQFGGGGRGGKEREGGGAARVACSCPRRDHQTLSQRHPRPPRPWPLCPDWRTRGAAWRRARPQWTRR